MQKQYPFKFLDAYTREDSDFFFGRSEEIDALYEMVFQTDLLLVFGASGTGKTSLIQCGLASKFQSHDWLALNIRRGSNLNDSFEKAIQEAGDSEQEHGDNLDWLAEDWIGINSNSTKANTFSLLANRFKAIYLKHFKPIYLIFDQFEELYILGDKDEQLKFIQTVKEILLVEQPVKIIVSIREEYLGYLYEFERAVPELLRKKLRVEPMNLDKVKTVIKGVGSLKQGNIRLQPGEENAIAEGIFEKIRGEEKSLTIQLPYLQVFLDKLYLQLTNDESRQFDAIFTMAGLSEIGDIGDVLRNFLDEQVLVTAQQLAQQPESIWRILSPFVTLDGTKEPMSEQDLRHRMPGIDLLLIGDTLRAFVNSRILRYSENEQHYEIAHDSLAKQIHDKRSDEEIAILEVQRLIKSQVALKVEAREPFTEKQLLFIEPYLDKFKPTDDEVDWIEKSLVLVQSQKEAAAEQLAMELEKTRAQAEEAERLKNKAIGAQKVAEKEKKKAQKLTIFSFALAILALSAMIGAGFLYRQSEKKNLQIQSAKERIQKHLDDLKNEQAETKKQQEEADRQRLEAEKRQKETMAAIEAQKREEAAKNKLKFEEILKQAEILFKAKQYPLAKQKYKEALSLAPPEKKQDIQSRINQCN